MDFILKFAIIFLLFSRSLFAENLVLHLSNKDYTKMNLFRLQAISKGYLTGDERQKVRIEIFKDGQIYPAKISYDGIGDEHFKGDNLLERSLNFNILKNNYINIGNYSFKNFRLVNPDFAYYSDVIKELIFLNLNDYFELPYRKLIPLNVSFSDDRSKKTLTFLEEKYDNDFIQRISLNEGLILERNIYNNNYINFLYNCKKNKINCENDILDHLNKPHIEAKKNNMPKQEKYAINLLQLYYQNKINFFDVFEEKEIIKLLYMSLLWNHTHHIQEHNIKFYFSPITKRFTILVSDPFLPIAIKENQTNPSFLFEQYSKTIKLSWVSGFINDQSTKIQIINKIRNYSNEININDLLEEVFNDEIVQNFYKIKKGNFKLIKSRLISNHEKINDLLNN